MALGVQITADGVTQPGQVPMLRELGVTRGQGWLFGRPVPWPDFLRRTDGGSTPPFWVAPRPPR